MTRLRNFLLLAATLSLASPLFASPQFGYGQGQQSQTLTCSSDDGGRHYCNANTSGGVQLTRQISGSACIQGSTWGYDMQGIWVDRGCRAQFTIGGSGYGPGYGQGQGQTLTCSSDDGKRHYCNANTSGGVQLTRQISGSACIQGSTWGYDNQGVWVDRGCRAQFTVNSYGVGPGYGQGQDQIVTCSSDDGKRHYCGGALRGRVQLGRQRSGSPCIEGRTWGHDRRGIWVDRGCRADFIVNTFTTGNGGGRTLTCSSDDGNRHYCNADVRGGVQLTRQISGSACIQGQTWGYDNRGVWVDRGCRAEFRTR